MSDHLKRAREIAARTEPRFIEIKPEPRRRATFVEIPRQRGGGRVPFTEAELTTMRGGLTAEEYRWKTIIKFCSKIGREDWSDVEGSVGLVTRAHRPH